MKIICIGRNYAEHAKELGNAVPDNPVIFMKPSTAMVINDKAFYYPEFTSNLHHEGEIVLKICENGKHIQPKFADKYFNEVTIGIDFTARDVQDQLKAKGQPWEIAKAFDGSAPLGKFIPKKDAFSNDGTILFSLKKNGAIVQSGDTKDLIFDFNHLICYVSKFFMLNKGDLIYTGTPAGVGPVQIGDLLEGYIGEQKLLSCEVK
jgi:acylpyruvate hydrolase